MSRLLRWTLVLTIGLWVAVALAAVAPPTAGRFDQLVLHDPGLRLGIVAETPEQIPGFDSQRAAWEAFRQANGGGWRVWVDRRSGTPTWVEGPGLVWFAAGEAPSPATLEARARLFVVSHEALLGIRNDELSWSSEASGPIGSDRHVLVFDRVVQGIPVEGETLVLYLARGRLVGFGASRWGSLAEVPVQTRDAEAALAILKAYMRLSAGESLELVDRGALVLLAAGPAEGAAPVYTGPAGAGIDHRLAWRFAVRVPGEPGTWVGKVDAVSGEVVAFYDDDKYHVRGGVYPISNDQNCADYGCEVAGMPMPYANVTLAKKLITTGDMGQFTCGKGPKNSSVALAGPYVRVADRCGTFTQTGNCTGDLDFGTSGGTDCTYPAGTGAGDSHAGRVNYHLLNRLKEKVRYWLPANSWANATLTANVNVSGTCNAYWNGSVNFYRSGGGCRNSGEIGAVVAHEWGHGLDQNDGGGYDNPSEGYADVTAILLEHRSCVGRGFFQSGTCSGYGDTCLSCTGIRDMDWDRRIRHTPATPANFTATNCGGGGGPCGREVHCESYVPSEAIYDLAARDLPAAGLDADSAWQLAEKLWYTSRQGAGGPAFSCALPLSDGCSATSWFNELRVADDDDGNLANGTPHGAAIFAAFDRHAIACGAAGDPSNQSTTSCPVLAQPALSATTGPGEVTLSWTAVAGASSYLVLRNEVGCDYSSNVIATLAAPATTYTDPELPSGLAIAYRVQAQGAGTSCESTVSACAAVTVP